MRFLRRRSQCAPLLLLASATLLSGCFGPRGSENGAATPSSVATMPVATPTPAPSEAAPVVRDDALLAFNLVGGKPVPNVLTSSVQLVVPKGPPAGPAPSSTAANDSVAQPALPAWVQAHRATPLWSGPDDKAVTLTDLPQWTYLNVAGIERGGRLLVKFAGDFATRQPGIGWVDQSAVGPSGEPGVWVSNFKATSLWSGTDQKAVKFTDVPQWTKLRVVAGAPADGSRMEIEFFGDGFTRQPGVAWIALSDVGPITPPQPLPAVPPAGAQAQHQTFGSGTDFIAAVGVAAQSSRKLTGVPASVTVAQAILESDWGRSRLTRLGNNLFGIKALNGPGPDGVVTLATREYTDGGNVMVQAPFKAYRTLEQSIDDHGKFFMANHRYAAALAVASDPKAFAHAIQDAGYATDPDYASKLIGLMDRYNLYRFDS